MRRRDIEKYVNEWFSEYPGLQVVVKTILATGETLPEAVTRIVTGWDQKRDKEPSPDMEETRKELYAEVDKLVAKVFTERPVFDDGHSDKLVIELGIACCDDDGKDLASYLVEHSSTRSR